jgi:hypothetical protein
MLSMMSPWVSRFNLFMDYATLVVCSPLVDEYVGLSMLTVGAVFCLLFGLHVKMFFGTCRIQLVERDICSVTWL